MGKELLQEVSYIITYYFIIHLLFICQVVQRTGTQSLRLGTQQRARKELRTKLATPRPLRNLNSSRGRERHDTDHKYTGVWMAAWEVLPVGDGQEETAPWA